jgi:hypothetical protein
VISEPQLEPWANLPLCSVLRGHTVQSAQEFLVHLARQSLHFGMTCDRKHFYGINDADVYLASLLKHDSVARQQKTEIHVLLESLVRKWRIARPKDDISRKFNSQLLLQLCFYIDLAENAKIPPS